METVTTDLIYLLNLFLAFAIVDVVVVANSQNQDKGN